MKIMLCQGETVHHCPPWLSFSKTYLPQSVNTTYRTFLNLNFKVSLLLDSLFGAVTIKHAIFRNIYFAIYIVFFISNFVQIIIKIFSFQISIHSKIKSSAKDCKVRYNNSDLYLLVFPERERTQGNVSLDKTSLK